MFTFVLLGNLIARESNMSSESQGRAYKVTVTYNIYYSYYEDRDQGNLVAEGVYITSGALIFDEYADTQDEAEEKAKNECMNVCSQQSGKYIGQRTYKGKSYYTFETRRVESARAEAK